MAKYYNYDHYQSSSTSSTSRTLEITILSGEDLRIDKRSIKKNAYVTVRSNHDNSQSTAVDEQGGSYPKWNQKLVVDAPAHAPSLCIEVRCKTAFGGDKIVGTASVPVSDFSGGYVPEGHLQFLSYRLRDSRGQKNGVINISVRTKGGPAAGSTCRAAVAAEQSNITVGVPVGRNNHFGGVVTGIPVCCQNDYKYY